jgi:hypothetical protein
MRYIALSILADLLALVWLALPDVRSSNQREP